MRTAADGYAPAVLSHGRLIADPFTPAYVALTKLANEVAEFVFGFAFSVAGTVVLLRAIEGHNIVRTYKAHIAVD